MINDSSSPIGIFDSGLGGLTIARAIKKRMPFERLVYFGDTLHFPYGDKSRETLKRYSLTIGRFLVKEGCKAIVIACNSVSSNAFPLFKEVFGSSILVFDVIRPVVHYIFEKTYKKVGLIATRATIESQVYEKLIECNCPHIQLCSLATPLLAPMVEEGFIGNEISSCVLRHYLNQETLCGIEVLLLGCTHYPMLFEEIHRFYNRKLPIIEATGFLVEQLHFTLKKRGSLSKNRTGEDVFYTSAFRETFNDYTQLFFGSKISLRELHLKF